MDDFGVFVALVISLALLVFSIAAIKEHLQVVASVQAPDIESMLQKELKVRTYLIDGELYHCRATPRLVRDGVLVNNCKETYMKRIVILDATNVTLVKE